MASATIEERLSELEEKVALLLDEKAKNGDTVPWWDQWFGAFKDSPEFEEAMHLGAEYRRAQPNAIDNPDAVEF